LFVWDRIEQPDLNAKLLGNNRFYETPIGWLPSVTTVIGNSSIANKEYLEEWKARVGLEEAARASGVASRRGTILHTMLEKYLSNDPAWALGSMPFHLENFRSIIPFLKEHIEVVHSLEMAVWSEALRTAGRTDVFCTINGCRTILDLKTSKGVKRTKDILHYFVQATCYARMVEERLGIEVPQIAIIMTSDYDPPRYWIRDRIDYDLPCLEVFNEPRKIEYV
jgi:hypothetical protein